MKPYYTIPEIAKMLKISRQAVDKRLQKEPVFFVRFGRTRVVKRADVLKIVTQERKKNR